MASEPARPEETLDLLPLRKEDDVYRVGTTRVTLDSIVTAFEQGSTAEEIHLQFPSLELADIYASIAYYLRHKVEIDAYLAERQSHRAALRADRTRRFGLVGLRERLMARRQQAG